jgi:thiamine biosynthesis lipoprotein ApbE
VTLLLCTLAALAVPAPGAGAAPADEPLHLSARAFGREVSLEVRDLPEAEAEAALRTAFERLQALEGVLEDARRTLNADPTTERALAVEPPAMALLERAAQFCAWSHGAIGPLGGSLEEHWAAVAGNPSPPPVPAALTETAACDRIRLDPEANTARLAAGSQVSFDAFAAGFAVDRTVDVLRELGAGNGLVRIGRVQRGFGAGPAPAAGRGWPAVLPAFEGYQQPFDVVRLDERALALVWRADWPPDRPRFVNQRTGEAPDDVWVTAAVTELAIDAQALAVAGVVLGPREGRFRMSALKPEPAVLWLLGSGKGRPLRTDLNWSDLHTP